MALRKPKNFIGAWLSLVERFVRDEEVARSNRVAPIFSSSRLFQSGSKDCSPTLVRRRDACSA